MYRSPGRCVQSRRDTAAPSAQLLTLRPGSDFWTLGHKLFGTTPETYPVAFLAGDILDGAFLALADPSYAATSTALAMATASNLSDMTCLSALHARVSVITICNVFHVFETEETQLKLARALGSLLSSEPGSMIVGRHNGLAQKGWRRGQSFHMFCHSPQSWEEMWDGVVFEKGTVKVEARLLEKQRKYMLDEAVRERPVSVLEWSVTRV